MNLRTFLERHAPTAFSVARVLGTRRFELFPPRVTYALGPLHRAIRRHFDSRDGIYFEVGANNGIDQSNTAYLDRYLGWRGILVEAIPHKFVECVKNRPDAKVYHAALVPFDYSSKVVEMTYSNLMSVSSVSGVDAHGHSATGEQFLKSESALASQTFFAPAKTVQSVIDDAGFAHIDLFSLDVEGAELAVLAGIDFARTRPRHFLIEAYDPELMHRTMRGYGYEVVEKLSFHDFLYRDARAPA